MIIKKMVQFNVHEWFEMAKKIMDDKTIIIKEEKEKAILQRGREMIASFKKKSMELTIYFHIYNCMIAIEPKYNNLKSDENKQADTMYTIVSLYNSSCTQFFETFQQTVFIRDLKIHVVWNVKVVDIGFVDYLILNLMPLTNSKPSFETILSLCSAEANAILPYCKTFSKDRYEPIIDWFEGTGPLYGTSILKVNFYTTTDVDEVAIKNGLKHEFQEHQLGISVSVKKMMHDDAPRGEAGVVCANCGLILL